MEPFAPSSISIRLYPHNTLDAPGIVTELCAQAKLALDQGFDGVMTSEHHGGVGGYLPNPLQMAMWILEENAGGWAAPCPLLLPLRPTAMVAEEVAWLDARHPGRVGLGVAAGASELDFTSMGLTVGDAVPRFKAGLPRIADMLRGQGLGGLDGDNALQRCREHPIPVLSAAVSAAAARRAARCGAGILLEGMSGQDRLSELCSAYDAAGGRQSKMLIRRVWLGDTQAELIADQRRFYEKQGQAQGHGQSGRPFPEDQTIAAPDSDQLAERIQEVWAASGADALNLRIHLPGIGPDDIRQQIVRLGAVLAKLRQLRSRHGG